MLLHRFRKCSPFCAMSFVLLPARTHNISAAISHQLETAKILEHRSASSSEHLDPLLRERSVAVGEIADGPFGAVCETQGNQYIVATITAGIADAPAPRLPQRRPERNLKRSTKWQTSPECARPLVRDRSPNGRQADGRRLPDNAEPRALRSSREMTSYALSWVRNDG